MAKKNLHLFSHHCILEAQFPTQDDCHTVYMIKLTIQLSCKCKLRGGGVFYCVYYCFVLHGKKCLGHAGRILCPYAYDMVQIDVTVLLDLPFFLQSVMWEWFTPLSIFREYHVDILQIPLTSWLSKQLDLEESLTEKHPIANHQLQNVTAV